MYTQQKSDENDKFESQLSNADKPTFICGFPSGGTDLLKTIVNAHPDVYINGEMPLLPTLVNYPYVSGTTFTSCSEIKDLQNILSKLNTWSNIENIDHDFSINLSRQNKLTIQQVLNICFSKRDTMIWGNKTPQNTENIDSLIRLFPDALFIIVVRDIREISLSWKKKWGKDPYLCASKWSSRMSEGWGKTKKLSEDQYLFVKFEDLLGNTKNVCHEICTFLGIQFSDRMLEHHKYTEKADGKINYGTPLQPKNTEKWRTQLSDNQIKRIEEIAFDSMGLFGYQKVKANKKRELAVSERILGKLNDVIALILVGNRASNNYGLTRRLKDILFETRKLILGKP